MELAFEQLSKHAKEPKLATNRSAGFDLFSSSIDDVIIAPGENATIPTDIRVRYPKNTCGLIVARSGLATKNKLMVMGGLCDPDYEGGIRAILFNAGSSPFIVSLGNRIAQLVVIKCYFPSKKQIGKKRGHQGFGSSGL